MKISQKKRFKAYKETKKLIGDKSAFNPYRDFVHHTVDAIISKQNYTNIMSKAEAFANTVQSLPDIQAYMHFVSVGEIMEINSRMLYLLNKEIEDSRTILQDLTNDCMSMQELIEPQLKQAIEKIRTTRMTVRSEFSKTLTSLKDVRKFFLEKEYEEEIARIERFSKVVSQLVELKENGTLDALSDVIIKLAIGEEDDRKQKPKKSGKN